MRSAHLGQLGVHLRQLGGHCWREHIVRVPRMVDAQVVAHQHVPPSSIPQRWHQELRRGNVQG
jgi:hypothetical protein